MPPPAAETVTDGTALLRAICKFPEDDDPRLQYADWLDEHADSGRPAMLNGLGAPISLTEIPPNGFAERAEFIRVGCALARNPVYQAKQQRKAGVWKIGTLKAIEEQEARLRELFRGEWFPVPDSGLSSQVRLDSHQAGGHDVEMVVRRGFVAEVRLPCAAFLGLAAALFAAHPVVSVSLVDKEPHWHGKGWAWYNPGRSRKSADVPTAAEAPAELLKPLRMEGDRFVLYASQEIAREAMSRAAVAFGRSQAGLEG